MPTPPTPLLFFSDAPSYPSGLGRICRDLASRIATHLPEIKVASIGNGGNGSARLPFQQYSWAFDGDWVLRELAHAWADFAEGEPGVLMTIQDASRMLWLARPELPELGVPAQLQEWLRGESVERWGYFPIDATGINNRFCRSLTETYLGYDRVLAYTRWAKQIVERSLGTENAGKRDLGYLPHGLEEAVFYPRDRKEARDTFCRRLVGRVQAGFVVNEGDLLVGIIATNQPRKDFGLGLAVVAELAQARKVKLWIHTDMLERNWSIPSLLQDYGLQNAMVTTAQFRLSDEQLAWAYSACDLTLGIGLGEGFGYPLFESLACGAPCVHGAYGGAAEFMPQALLVQPYTMRLETPYNCQRPVFRTEDWVRVAQKAIGMPVALPEELKWSNLWPRWEAWFKRGLHARTQRNSATRQLPQAYLQAAPQGEASYEPARAAAAEVAGRR